LPSLLVRGLPDLEVPALKRGQNADSGFLRVRCREAGNQATVFCFDVLNPVQRQQASRSGSVTCDRDKVVGHATGTLLRQPGGFEGLVTVLEHRKLDNLAVSKCPQRDVVRCDRGSAPPTLAGLVPNHEYPLVIDDKP
jgi:hypothetical protein